MERDTSTKSTGMASVPFAITDLVKERIEGLKSASHNWIELVNFRFLPFTIEKKKKSQYVPLRGTLT